MKFILFLIFVPALIYGQRTIDDQGIYKRLNEFGFYESPPETIDTVIVPVLCTMSNNSIGMMSSEPVYLTYKKQERKWIKIPVTLNSYPYRWIVSEKRFLENTNGCYYLTPIEEK